MNAELTKRDGIHKCCGCNKRAHYVLGRKNKTVPKCMQRVFGKGGPVYYCQVHYDRHIKNIWINITEDSKARELFYNLQRQPKPIKKLIERFLK